MPPNNPTDLFTHCLDRLQAGEPLEKILADYPSQAEDLRPLLGAAWAAVSANAQPSTQVLAGGMARSRVRFLEAAAQLQPKPARSPWQLFPVLRLAGALALALALIFGGLFATELASAESLPGQPLYGFKRSLERARLALTATPTGRLLLQDAFDLRRAAEVAQLIQRGQSQAANFAGFLRREEPSGWSASGIHLPLTPYQDVVARDLLDRYVEIEALVRGQQGLQVQDLRLRLYQISGTIQQQQGSIWLVDGLRITIGRDTQVNGAPQAGDRISLTAVRLGENDFYALAVKSGSGGQPANPGTANDNTRNRGDTPGKSTQPAATLSPDSNENEQGGGDPGGNSNTSGDDDGNANDDGNGDDDDNANDDGDDDGNGND